VPEGASPAPSQQAQVLTQKMLLTIPDSTSSSRSLTMLRGGADG
jgi:hypothetical protein